jgi:hypothetical protein
MENNSFKIKQIALIVIIIVVIVATVMTIIPKKEKVAVPDENTAINTEVQKPIAMCYYKGDKTSRGFYDIAWLKLNILGDKVTGEFNNLPAEKDTKVGKFEGTVGSLIPETMGRRADVIWDSLGEGMNVKEELVVDFGDGSASAGFGEMIDRGDGVYLYKDKANLTYSIQMSQIDCDTLDEKLFVEKYVSDNIKTVATNKPVLGGSWYVISVVANPIAHNGEVVYEDGHIQSKANFIYDYTKTQQSVTVTKFEVTK